MKYKCSCCGGIQSDPAKCTLCGVTTVQVACATATQTAELRGTPAHQAAGKNTTQISTTGEEPAPAPLRQQMTEAATKMVKANHPTMWAIGIDYGTEGQTPPLTLVATEQEARGLVAFVGKFYGTAAYCMEVPMWPGVREE